MNSTKNISISLVFMFSIVFVTYSEARARSYSVEVETGLGYDSNAFRSPDKSYFDPFSKTTLNPEVQSGLFVPFRLKGLYKKSLRKVPWLKKVKLNSWSSEIRLRGRKYLSSALDNADAHRVSGKTGVRFLLKKAGKKRYTLYIGPVIEQKKATYYDRDTGVEKVTSLGLPLGDRYNYYFYGIETELKVRLTRVQYAIRARTRTYDYKATAFDQFDHLYYRIGAEASYKIIRTTKLTAGYAYAVRDYDVWVARDLNGKKVPLVNPTRKYIFGELDVSLKHRLTSLWTLSLAYNRLTRNDDFVGYADYTRERYQFQTVYKDKKGRRLRVSFLYWSRSHPNTFAFDKVTVNNLPSPKTDYDAVELKLSGEMPLYKAWTIWGEIDSFQQEVTDPRYEYERKQFAGGIKVNF